MYQITKDSKLPTESNYINVKLLPPDYVPIPDEVLIDIYGNTSNF